MKIKVLTLMALSICAANAAITVTLSGTTSVLTNLTVDGTSTSQRLVWGIIVDGSGNGYQSGNYIPGFETKLGPQILSTTTGATDDVLYLAGSVFSASGTGDGSTGMSRPLSATNIAVNANGVDVGDNFAIVWFNLDNVALGATTITATANALVPTFLKDMKYGMLTTSSPTAQTIPTDGQTRDLTGNFTGPDTLRTASFALVPETSTALLGALGVLGLLRRRR